MEEVMAKNITVQVTGGEAKPFAEGISTVQEAFDALELEGNYSATINGDGADMSDDLSDYAFVAFSLQVKGGARVANTVKVAAKKTTTRRAAAPVSTAAVSLRKTKRVNVILRKLNANLTSLEALIR